ncbi:MAG: hypothetical protein AB8G15_06130 [Saprospiraceae bacterium]
MMLNIFEGMTFVGVCGRVMIIAIFSIFFPLTAISYLRYLVPKKEKEYQKALDDLGIRTQKKVRDTYSLVRFILPIGFSFLICFFAIAYIVFADQFVTGMKDNVVLSGAAFGKDNAALMARSISVLTFAFLGSFIWSATNIIRRLIANDLSPSVYYSAGIRILLASITALVLSFMLGAKSNPEYLQLNASLAAIAFLTGMFPERVLQYLIKVFQRFINADQLTNNHLSLYRIQGISMQHKERLEEIGIDNAQNLASASITNLLIETPFKSRQLLDWIGQAKLICFAGKNIDKLRSVGIRSVFDFFSPNKESVFFQDVCQQLEMDTTFLSNIYDQVMADQGIRTLYGFMNEGNRVNEEAP